MTKYKKHSKLEDFVDNFEDILDSEYFFIFEVYKRLSKDIEDLNLWKLFFDPQNTLKNMTTKIFNNL